MGLTLENRRFIQNPIFSPANPTLHFKNTNWFPLQNPHSQFFDSLLCSSAFICSSKIEKLLKDEAIEENGECDRMASFVGAMEISDLVKTTLGTKGMDKILQSTGRITTSQSQMMEQPS